MSLATLTGRDGLMHIPSSDQSDKFYEVEKSRKVVDGIRKRARCPGCDYPLSQRRERCGGCNATILWITERSTGTSTKAWTDGERLRPDVDTMNPHTT